ncbi:sigma-54-dependent Fis family transcriptional regulator [Candidatus Woesearchaeota archaeon]|nr:sigma-54-dependent Fis family transcriptional regulator [Candidatus Woesearchaeota archaeon]
MATVTVDAPTIELCLPHYVSREGLVIVSRSMQAVYADIQKAASVISNLLILGESGTGKDTVAYAVHKNSSRQGKKLVRVDMAALPRELLEAELFGYCKGAFTHAIKDRQGRFLYAHGSTLFLNEIVEIDTQLQAKLLSAIEYKEVTRLGEDEAKTVDARIIATTNRDIHQEMRQGNFRQDLYYRLAVLTIHLPPLRERREDIPYLIAFLMQKHQRILDIATTPFKQQEYGVFQNEYDWPGNVRELSNVVEHIIATGKDKIGVLDKMRKEALTIYGARNPGLGSASMGVQKLAETEKSQILSALREYKGNITLIADKLGVTRQTLKFKLNQYITRDDITRALEQSNGDRNAAAGLLGMKQQTFHGMLIHHKISL